jgi:hypothetical protein
MAAKGNVRRKSESARSGWVLEHEGRYGSRWETIRSIAGKVGCSTEAPRPTPPLEPIPIARARPESVPPRLSGRTAIETFQRSFAYLFWRNLYLGGRLMTTSARVSTCHLDGDRVRVGAEHRYGANLVLHGDRDVGIGDTAIASLSLFLEPGPCEIRR